jgi:hypothetical protein
MIFDKTAYVARLNKNQSDIDKEQYVTFSGFGGTAAIKINIQPASPEITALADGVVGKTYTAFVRASGVSEGMRLTVSGTGEQYIVRARATYNYGVEQHQELTLFKSDKNVP